MMTHVCGSVSSADCQPAVMSARVITPIVFCASLVPCASATSDDEKIWPTRNPSRPSGLAVVAPRDHVGDLGRGVRDDPGGQRRDDRREDDLRHHDAEVDRHVADADDRRADEPAEQRVRRGRRQPEQPREHVPGDRADEPREDDRGEQIRRDLVLADDPARDRLGDLGGQERADEVQDRGDQHRRLGLERTRSRWASPSRWRCRGSRS